MSIFSFATPARGASGAPCPGDILAGHSIEVMPRTAAGIADFRAILPPATRIYVAHIEGTPFDAMVATAARLRAEGFAVMPHLPARLIRDRAEAETWLGRYADAGVTEALVLAGGARHPAGAFDSAMQLLDTGLFERAGFTRLHVAGHPEGSRDIDPEGGTRAVDAALRWKQAYADSTAAEMAIVTQFGFDAAPVIAWADRLRAAGITLPIHVGVAGPAKLQTLLKFAIACGVGASLSVLQKRAADVTRLLLPYEPQEVLSHLAAHRQAVPDTRIAGVHLFPLGGIEATAAYARRERRPVSKTGSATG